MHGKQSTLVQDSHVPRVRQRNRQRDAEERVKGVTLLLAMWARQRGPGASIGNRTELNPLHREWIIHQITNKSLCMSAWLPLSTLLSPHRAALQRLYKQLLEMTGSWFLIPFKVISLKVHYRACQEKTSLQSLNPASNKHHCKINNSPAVAPAWKVWKDFLFEERSSDRKELATVSIADEQIPLTRETLQKTHLSHSELICNLQWLRGLHQA